MTTQDLAPSRLADYSHVFWKNGARRSVGTKARLETTQQSLLCFETGYFGLCFDLADLTSVRFSQFPETDPSLSYTECLQRDHRRRMNELTHVPFNISIVVDGSLYRATSCAASHTDDTDTTQVDTPFNGKALLWESGRLVQRISLLSLDLCCYENCDELLKALTFNLDVVVWPKSMSLTLSMDSQSDWSNVVVTMEFSNWTTTRRIERNNLTPDKQPKTTLICDIVPWSFPSAPIKVATNRQAVPVAYAESYHCQVARVEYGHGKPKFVRTFPSGYTDIRDYDEFVLHVASSSSEADYVPFLLEIIDPANVTGMCPLVCSSTGAPTGIPVQLCKNWHVKEIGPYFRGFALLPLPPHSEVSYLIRLVYGFYGTLPAASHAQLSLVGCKSYSGRWDQLAIGCFGETLCIDPETSWVTNTITDIRGLMLRNGTMGTKWQWTDCGWGGDWLSVKDRKTRSPLTIVDMKTAYASHGPCLTDVRYAGSYGDRHQVDYNVRVRTLRTDDYARTFQDIEYTFNDRVTMDDGWLLMSRTRGFVAPSFAYGNKSGLVAVCSADDDRQKGNVLLEDVVVDGDAPFWFSFPDSYQFRGKDWGTGTKHWILRSYSASVGRSHSSNPCVQCIVFCTHGRDKKPGLEVRLRPPPGVSEFQAGDRVQLCVEWVTTATTAGDYYGPNRVLRRFLGDHPRSWRVPYREATGNDLQVEVVGGRLERIYPICIAVSAECVDIYIVGGVGACPIEFCGLASTKYTLYEVDDERTCDLKQAVNGNDYWQVDYDARAEAFSMTFNVELDGRETSVWRLTGGNLK